MSYNVLLTNVIVKPIVPTIITKSTLTYTNCGKIGHSMETFHNRKKKVLVVPSAIVKSIKLIAGINTQPIKLGKILVHYPCIICSSIKHRFGECRTKIEI